jgi:hypothetical protein
MKSTLLAATFLLSATFFASTSIAGDKLDRASAMKMIKEHYPPPLFYVLREGKYTANEPLAGTNGYGENGPGNVFHSLQLLETAGYVTLKGVRGGETEITLTKKGKETFKPDPSIKSGWKVIIGGYLPSKITGIFFSGTNTAEVEFETPKAYTAPSDIVNAADDACLGCVSRDKPVSRVALFKLYDDGWRFVKELDQR